ncbi:MAG: UDP-N-acetylmuramoyl-L-alanine--D-glutamate ligase [Pseudomonadota bacterium]|nr:UDP-N-acetylmuramoyl-L-alanine--D-glutamate ligase [Pseudomonadota bacterium]
MQPRTLVVGLGATGLSVVRHLRRQGADCAITDTRSVPPGLEALDREFPDTPRFFGPLDAKRLLAYERLVLSPGVARSEPAIQSALRAGVEVTGDIALFREAWGHRPLVGITGSNGKSTVTTLLGGMCAASGTRVLVGGNLGPPALDALAMQPDAQVAVLELSSFQLELVDDLGATVALLLNLSPDHLDRYPDIEAYRAAKERVFTGARCAVADADNPDSLPRTLEVPRILYRLSRPLPDEVGCTEAMGANWVGLGHWHWVALSELPLGQAGAHNVKNLLAAFAAGMALGLAPAAMVRGASAFAGLPHRCQRLGEHRGVLYVDDSKGTNVGAAAAAIEGIAQGRFGKLLVLLGGTGKGTDYRDLCAPLHRHARVAVLYGAERAALFESLRGAVECVLVDDLGQAVREAAKRAQAGDCVLLSPACASFDQFRDYRHRGQVFQKAVAEIAA